MLLSGMQLCALLPVYALSTKCALPIKACPQPVLLPAHPHRFPLQNLVGKDGHPAGLLKELLGRPKRTSKRKRGTAAAAAAARRGGRGGEQPVQAEGATAAGAAEAAETAGAVPVGLAANGGEQAQQAQQQQQEQQEQQEQEHEQVLQLRPAQQEHEQVLQLPPAQQEQQEQEARDLPAGSPMDIEPACSAEPVAVASHGAAQEEAAAQPAPAAGPAAHEAAAAVEAAVDAAAEAAVAAAAAAAAAGGFAAAPAAAVLSDALAALAAGTAAAAAAPASRPHSRTSTACWSGAWQQEGWRQMRRTATASSSFEYCCQPSGPQTLQPCGLTSSGGTCERRPSVCAGHWRRQRLRSSAGGSVEPWESFAQSLHALLLLSM